MHGLSQEAAYYDGDEQCLSYSEELVGLITKLTGQPDLPSHTFSTVLYGLREEHHFGHNVFINSGADSSRGRLDRG